MNLGEALDQALSQKFPIRTIQSGVTSKRGLTARMNALEKAGGSEAGGARLAGVTLRTWRGWKSGKTKPSKASLGRVESAHSRMAQEYHRSSTSRRMARLGSSWMDPKVHADVEWNGYSRGVRTVSLDPVDMSGVLAAWVADDKRAMEDAFHEAVEDTYGVPVTFPGSDVDVEL